MENKPTKDTFISKNHAYNSGIPSKGWLSGQFNIGHNATNWGQDFVTYYKNENKVITKGKTKAIIDNLYTFNSKDVFLDRNIKEIKSNKNSTIEDDNQNQYKLSNFKYSYKKKIFKR